jgi:hypothetical protein
MKNLTKFSIIIILLISSIIALQSCKKYRQNRATTSSSDNSLAENAFDDVYKVVNETAEDESSNKASGIYSFGNCATVTVDPAWPDTTFPKTVTVDFGTSCTGYDGRTRKGKVEYTITDRYRNTGCTITVTPIDYYVNDYKVEGSKSVTNNGRNSSNNLNYTIQITNGKVTTPDGEIITWESTRNREWIEGEETNFFTIDPATSTWMGVDGILDDVYSITGSASGTNRDDVDYTVTITSPLIVKLNCRWITQGVLEIEPDGLEKRTIDYGNGDCDENVTVEIDGRTYDITLLR